MASDPYAVAPDIAEARTLPGRYYRDRDVWDVQRQRLFPRTWHLFPEGSAPTRGEQVPWTLLPGALDEPLVLVGDGPRCLSNVCTHRGAVIVDERQQARALRCPYHGRRFSLEGRCLSAPGFEGREGFPERHDHLPEVALGTFGPLCWASLSPAMSIDDQLRPLTERTAWLPWDRLEPHPERMRRYRVSANWALYVDNYLEGLHIPFVHPGLTGTIRLDSYTTELFDGVSLQWSEAADAEPAFSPPDGHPDHGRRIAAYYLFLFPCTMVNVYPWGVSANVVQPRGIADTEIVYATWVWDGTLAGRGAGAGLDTVELEDEAVVARVQRGIASRLYDRGSYAPEAERGVHHFHQLLRDERFIG